MIHLQTSNRTLSSQIDDDDDDDDDDNSITKIWAYVLKNSV